MVYSIASALFFHYRHKRCLLAGSAILTTLIMVLIRGREDGRLPEKDGITLTLGRPTEPCRKRATIPVGGGVLNKREKEENKTT